MKRLQPMDAAGKDAFEYHLSAAVLTGVFLMLVMGLFGHNLFRHNWLWYGGFLVIARYCTELRIRQQQAMQWQIGYERVKWNVPVLAPIPAGNRIFPHTGRESRF
jgi:hypothetical protein